MLHGPRGVAIAAAAALFAFAGVARGEAFARRASLGLLDVPVAETIGLGNASFGVELHLERTPQEWRASPLPLSVVGGIGPDFDLGFSARYGGLPGDGQAPVLLWTLGLKYSVVRAKGWRPLVALEAVVDRPNAALRPSMRAIVSSRSLGPLRLTGFAGAELDALGGTGVLPTAGAALAVRHGTGLEGVVEGLTTTGGWLVGAGARWAVLPNLGLSVSATWIPAEGVVRTSLGLSVFIGTPRLETPPQLVLPDAREAGEAQKQTPDKPHYLDDRPRFRLKLRPPRDDGPAGRHLQYGPAEPGDARDDEEAPGPSPAPSPPQETPDIPKQPGAPPGGAK